MFVKTVLLLASVVCLLAVAGCTTTGTTTPAPTAAATTPAVSVTAGGDVLPMHGHAILGTGNRSIDVSLDSIVVEAPDESGNREITIYVKAHNNATDPVRLVWFSKLTTADYNTYGGIAASHSGNGARSEWIYANWSEAARDYVVVHSAGDLADLAKGARLDVYFYEKPTDDPMVSYIPDYHAAWAIDPGVIG